MNYRLLVIEALALIITGGISSLVYLYATYTNKRLLSKLFVPKNDSIWEHIKVLLAPILVLTIIEFTCCTINGNFVFAKFFSTILIVFLVPIIFLILYKFSGWDMIKMNITADLVSLLSGLLIFMILININELPLFISITSFIGLVLIATFYVIATFYPTNSIMFIDPETKKAKIKRDE